MDENNIEYNFKEWFEYSRSKDNQAQVNMLKRVLLTKQSKEIIDISEKVSEGEIYYCIVERYNPVLLYVNSNSCQEFYSYLCDLFPEEKPEKIEVKNTQENVNEQIDSDSNIDGRTNIFRMISSKKPIIHTLRFSLLAFIILQVLILPGNISDYKLPSWSYIVFFGVLVCVFYMSIWSYSKFISNLKSYNDIFKFSIFFFCLFYLFVFIEIMIIDSIGSDNFSILFSLLLIILGQVVGVLFSLFFAAIIYFIKGGKMINVS